MDSNHVPKETKNSIVRVMDDGVKTAWPICLGYVPIGLAFGILAQKAGLRPSEIGFMSLLVFAGSAQFIAVSMVGSGAAIFPIIITTLTINLRHLLMSSSLALHLHRLTWSWLALFAYGITDESFAVNLTKFQNDQWDLQRALVVNHASNATWIGSTIAGGYGGQLIPAGALGIDYALIAMFLCLVALQLRGPLYVITAIIAGALAVIVSLIVPGNAHIIIASAVAATVGIGLRRSGGFSPNARK